ncbi:MAG: class I SAM-dependent methyltransferase [Candidatus Desulforudis sp.]|nr:class I SAM-dependent methyltransferase [Desulforudis sp.]
MIHKEKILLTEEQETLLVPLYSRAVESRQPEPIFVDRKAQEILEHVEYDFAKLKIPGKTAVTLCIRAKKIDAYARKFLAGYPKSVVIHLGCGLDSRHTRVNNGEVEWYDLDMPEVIDLRKRFYEETASYHMIPSSVTDMGWTDLISPGGRPVLVIAEGLFMYLKEEEVKALILKLKKAFPGCGLVFDAYSALTARSAGKHPSIKKTGAVIHWGIDDPAAIEQWAEGIRLKEEWYFTQAEDLEKLGSGYRLLFRIAGLFTAARKAHRILYYNL